VTIPRLYRPGDPVREHVKGIYEEFGLAFDDAFEDDLSDVPRAYAGGAFWVVEDDTGIAATAAVVPYGAARLVKRIYVAERARRAGVARSLLRRCAGLRGLRADGALERRALLARAPALPFGGFRARATRVLADPDRSVERYFRR